MHEQSQLPKVVIKVSNFARCIHFKHGNSHQLIEMKTSDGVKK